MPNDFQTWLIGQGYYRKKESRDWWFGNDVVSGSDLHSKLKEWKSLTT